MGRSNQRAPVNWAALGTFLVILCGPNQTPPPITIILCTVPLSFVLPAERSPLLALRLAPPFRARRPSRAPSPAVLSKCRCQRLRTRARSKRGGQQANRCASAQQVRRCLKLTRLYLGTSVYIYISIWRPRPSSIGLQITYDPLFLLPAGASKMPQVMVVARNFMDMVAALPASKLDTLYDSAFICEAVLRSGIHVLFIASRCEFY
jgi:hypothetical protein